MSIYKKTQMTFNINDSNFVCTWYEEYNSNFIFFNFTFVVFSPNWKANSNFFLSSRFHSNKMMERILKNVQPLLFSYLHFSLTHTFK